MKKKKMKKRRIKQCPQAAASCHLDGWPAGRGRVGPKATSSQKIKVDKQDASHYIGIYKKG